jgi:hypothetical protein
MPKCKYLCGIFSIQEHDYYIIIVGYIIAISSPRTKGQGEGEEVRGGKDGFPHILYTAGSG